MWFAGSPWGPVPLCFKGPCRGGWVPACQRPHTCGHPDSGAASVWSQVFSFLSMRISSSVVAPWVVPGASPGATWSPLGCTSRDTSGSGEIEELRLGHGLRHTWSPLPAARLRLILGRLTGIASKPCLMERRADQSGGAVTPAVSPGLCLKGLLRAGNALTMGTAGVERRELHRQSWIVLCTVHGHARRW